MARVLYKSRCCNAEAKTVGTPDFLGSDEVCTVSFVCLECNNPCDIARPKQKVSAALRSTATELNINDDVEFRLTKEGRKIYRDYCRKYRYAPFRKAGGRWFRVELWEFMHIFGSRMFMGADAVIVGNIIRIPKS